MGRIKFDKEGERFYETGVKHGILFPYGVSNTETGAKGYLTGVPWNGLTAVNESPSGAEASPLYADDIKYLNLMSNEEFSFTIEAYTYPKEFEKCDGSASLTDGVSITAQPRTKFGFAYETTVGNDEKGIDYGRKFHIVYGCVASPSGKDHATINESPEAMTMSWEITTTPIEFTGFKPTAHVVIDTSKLKAITGTNPKTVEEQITELEDMLYGTDAGTGGGTATDSKLPMPSDLMSIFGVTAG